MGFVPGHPLTSALLVVLFFSGCGGVLWAIKSRARENRASTIVNRARDAIVMIDGSGKICFWNHAAEEMFGYPKVEAMRRDVHELISPQRYMSRYREAFPEFQRSGHGSAIGKTIDVQGVRRDGTEIDVELSLSSVRVRGTQQAIAVLRDVSERVREHRELLSAKVELEQSNRRLVASIERVDRLAEEAQVAQAAKSRFLATMGHELRTPLNGVIGMTDLLLGTDLGPQQREEVDIVRMSADNLLGTLSKVLEYSALEAKTRLPATVAFDLAAFLEPIVADIARRAGERGLCFRFRLDPDVPLMLIGDPDVLAQVLDYLSENALKFTEAGRIVLDVRTEQMSDTEARLRFRLLDSGPGIPPDRMDSVFLPFEQADNTNTRQYPGTGLGLAISKKLLEIMGGDIRCESLLGTGTEFSFSIAFGRQEWSKGLPARLRKVG